MHRCWNHFAAFALSLIASFTIVTPAVAQEFPADWEFVTMRTPHFDLIVNAKQQELGRFYAVKLEKAYALVTPLFTSQPGRTTVVLADKTDLTNGYATRIPYPHIFIYPVLPGPQDSLGETGDWVLELVSHEFTHVMTFESVTGGADILQHVFGTILSPNLLLPTWWKEGVAVQVESTVSQGGRLRSAYQDAVVREFSESHLLGHFDLAQINEVPPEWPQGLQPYVFGSVFWSEAVAEKGPKIIDGLHQRHGGRVPYFVEAPARDLLGASYETVHARAIADLDSRAQKQIAALRRTPLVEGEELKFETQFAQGPRVSPDGERLAFVGVDERLRRSIRVLKRRSPTSSFVDAIEEESFVNKREDLVQPPSGDSPASGSISRVSWMPDSRHIVFDKVDLVSRYESYSDLWSFDIRNGKTERLTRGLRAREPFVTPDGRGILFVGLDGGRTWLGRYDVVTKQTKELWRGQWQDRISFPAALADGSIVFAVRGANGREGLREIPADGREARVILDNYPDARFPEPTREGLLFTSSKNGVHNLYVSRDYDSARPVSHTIGGMFASGVDARTGDVYATMLTDAGPKIHRLPSSVKPPDPPETPSPRWSASTRTGTRKLPTPPTRPSRSTPNPTAPGTTCGRATGFRSSVFRR